MRNNDLLHLEYFLSSCSTPSRTEGLLLNLCSVLLAYIGDHIGSRDQTHVSCVQGKFSTHILIVQDLNLKFK